MNFGKAYDSSSFVEFSTSLVAGMIGISFSFWIAVFRHNTDFGIALATGSICNDAVGWE